MRLTTLIIKKGFFEKTFSFANNTNIIYSKKNSCGKTTLIRLLLYALGFNIPNTKNIKFNSFEVSLTLNHEVLGNINLIRERQDQIILIHKSKRVTFSLPGEEKNVHQLIFNTENTDIINNLLGTFYIDQEKGWTLLNRGTVIGSIHFNIEELIRGLGNKNSDKLLLKSDNINREIKQYKQILNISKYQKSIQDEANDNITDFDSTLLSQLEILRIEYRRLKREKEQIDKLLSDNKNFKTYIESMKLMIRINDKVIPLTSDKIEGYNDTIDSLKSKLRFISEDINQVFSKIKKLEKDLIPIEEQDSLFTTQSWTKKFNVTLSKLHIDQTLLEEYLQNLYAQKKIIDNEIKIRTKENNSAAISLYKSIKSYAEFLGVNFGEEIKLEYIFTSNLKELSGALLQKLVFSFKLSYLKETEKVLGIKLPIIIDSPSAKELDSYNVKLMFDILKNDFPDNQIFIASIYKYDFNESNAKFIELKGSVLE